MTRRSLARARLLALVLVLPALAACRQVFGIQDQGGATDDGGSTSSSGDGAATTTSGSDAGGLSSDAAGGAIDSGTQAGDDGGTIGNEDAGTVCMETTCTPVVYQQGLYGPVALAVDSTHVYWIEVGMTIPQADQYGQLVRLPKVTTCKARSCFEVLDYDVLAGELEGQYIYDTHIALGANDVCYTQSYNATPEHAIKCVSLAGQLPEREIETGAGDVVDLWVSGTQGRWVTDSSERGTADGLVLGDTLTSGSTVTLASKRLSPSAVTSDGTATYFTELGDASPNGVVDSLSGDGGVTTLFPGRADPLSVKVFGIYLYWIEQSARKIMRGRADGSGSPEQIATTDEMPFDLVVDPSGVYWASAGTGNSGLYGSVAHAPLTPGGMVTTMFSNIDKVTKVAVDPTSVWVASTGTKLNAGKIVVIPKTH